MNSLTVDIYMITKYVLTEYGIITEGKVITPNGEFWKILL